MLLFVTVYPSCFQFLEWPSFSPVGAQLLWFVPPQLFGVYPWQAYVPPDTGLLPMQVAAPSAALSRGILMLIKAAVLQPFNWYG